MPRSRQRVCLQDGLKLDLNWLARNGFVQFGADTGFRGIRWTHSCWGEIANGSITADMSDPAEAWLRVEIGSLVQLITLVSRPRHFGGRQWFAQRRIVLRPSSGSLPALKDFAAAKPGAARLPTVRNFKIPQTERILARPGSSRG
jgi:hypothetical protein